MSIVSIIMPAYNAAPYIAQSIASVQAQTFRDWELLVVDDESTDNTAEIVQAIIAQDSRIKYYWRKNGRQGKARNTALAHIPPDRPYIAFLDADDLWMPEKLEIQLAQIAKSGADLVFCSFIVFSAENDHISVQEAGERAFEGDEAIAAFLRANKIGVLTVLVKRPAVAEVGNFIEDPAVQNTEDYHLWLKLLMAGKRLQGYAVPMARYRVHATASTANMLNIIRPEIALFEQLTFANAALETIRRSRLIALYRHLLQLLAEAGDRKAISESLKSFGAFSGAGRIARVLQNVAAINLTLFKKVSWRLLSTLAS